MKTEQKQMVWMELYLAVVKCCEEDCSAHCDAFVVERRKNGRMYDPYIARFLSPDRSALCDAFIAKWRKNYVQLPTSAQSFNRYSYCLNNPLKYTDVFLVFLACVGKMLYLCNRFSSQAENQPRILKA